MVSFPHGKINLGLHVIAKRDDGYHNLETCFYPVPCTDILEILPAVKTSLTVTGRSVPGKPDENLCVRAYERLRKEFSLPPVHIHLHKILPMGAGLGGGSSDAAFTLKMANAIFDLRLTMAQLETHAAAIGSDCAFFLHDQPMLAKGRGEQLSPAACSLKGKFLLLVVPPEHVSTAEAFSNLTPAAPARTLEEVIQTPVPEWKALLKNDFEESVFRKFPSIRLLKEKMYSLGAEYAGMTGSGS